MGENPLTPHSAIKLPGEHLMPQHSADHCHGQALQLSVLLYVVHRDFLHYMALAGKFLVIMEIHENKK